jgi:hypothetical protein
MPTEGERKRGYQELAATMVADQESREYYPDRSGSGAKTRSDMAHAVMVRDAIRQANPDAGKPKGIK